MAKKVLIETNQFALNARMYGSSDANALRPALIFFTGWNPGNVSWTFSDIYARLCAWKFNYTCITVGFRGMGSAGDINMLTRSDFLDDAMAVYDFMTNQKGIDKERISIIAESFGSYIACILSSKRAVRNLVLRVPSDFPNEGFSDAPQVKFAGNLSLEWKTMKHLPHEDFALNALHQFRKKVYVIGSEDDELIPFQTTENYLNAADPENLEYHLMKKTGHALINPLKVYSFIKILLKIVGRPEF